MKSILLLPVLAALFFSACVTPPSKRGTAQKQLKTSKRITVVERMSVRTTAYTHTEAGGRKNAIGSRLRFGGAVSSAASDWSWLPLGTRFRLVTTGRIYVIEDYGSALVGKKTVDLYMPTRGTMRAWGVRNVEIEILEWGSWAMSLKLLEPRQRNRYVRAMVYSLRNGNSGRVPRSGRSLHDLFSIK